jgi:hypothetical protein
MTLERKDILQINATVIAGVLILFTLTFSFTDNLPYQPSLRHRLVFGVFPLLIVIPFCISAYKALGREFLGDEGYMRLGFFLIPFFLVIIITLYIADYFFPWLLHTTTDKTLLIENKTTDSTKTITPRLI